MKLRCCFMKYLIYHEFIRPLPRLPILCHCLKSLNHSRRESDVKIDCIKAWIGVDVPCNCLSDSWIFWFRFWIRNFSPLNFVSRFFCKPILFSTRRSDYVTLGFPFYFWLGFWSICCFLLRVLWFGFLFLSRCCFGCLLFQLIRLESGRWMEIWFKFPWFFGKALLVFGVRFGQVGQFLFKVLTYTRYTYQDF